MTSSDAGRVFEWVKVQVWHEGAENWYYSPTELLYFPSPYLDVERYKKAIAQVMPRAVIPPRGETFELTSIIADTLRSDFQYKTGIILDGQFEDLERRLQWATDMGYTPIVIHGACFHGAQNKELWQMQVKGDLFRSGAWYHLATSEPHPFSLPGEWTVGGDFVRRDG